MPKRKLPESYKSKLILDDSVLDVTDVDLNDALKMYLREYEIEDFKKESQNVFHASMTYIYMHVFSGTKRLICDGDLSPIQSLVVKETGQSYDPIKLFKVLNWYTFTADNFDKVKTICGFSYLTGVGKETLYSWYGNSGYWNSSSDWLTAEKQSLIKKLRELEEDSLTAINITGKRNPVGIMEVLNHSYQHNLVGVSKEVKINDNDVGRIAEKLGLSIDQKSNI